MGPVLSEGGTAGSYASDERRMDPDQLCFMRSVHVSSEEDPGDSAADLTAYEKSVNWLQT